jgi:hypothetical protein
MSYPEHPDTVVIRNKFYPRGMTEKDVYEYYQKVKNDILEQVRHRDLMFFIMVDTNKPIVRRKAKTGYIRLTAKNYDEVITGRTVSIHSAMNAYENIGIIDIDITEYDGFKWARKAAFDVYNFVMDKMPIVRKAQIRFTGKGSFHVVCEFSRKMKIDSIRFLLERFLRDSELSKVYTIEGKRRPGVPNLDLAPNKLRGNFITLHSMSVLGLRCMEVPYNQILRFDPKRAVV